MKRILDTSLNKVKQDLGGTFLVSREGFSEQDMLESYILRFDQNNLSVYLETSFTSLNYKVTVVGDYSHNNRLIPYLSEQGKLCLKLESEPNSDSTFDCYYIKIEDLSGRLVGLYNIESTSEVQNNLVKSGDVMYIRDISSYTSLFIKSTNKISPSIDSGLNFKDGSLLVNTFKNKELRLPLSIAVTYEVDSWEGLGSGTDKGICFFNTYTPVWTSPYQLVGLCLKYDENKTLTLMIGNPDSTPALRRMEFRNTAGLPVGKHTLVVCVGNTISGGTIQDFSWYLDGEPLSKTSYYNTLNSDNVTSTEPLRIGSTYNYSVSERSGPGINVLLSRVVLVNFKMDDLNSPYSVEDYINHKYFPLSLKKDSREDMNKYLYAQYAPATGTNGTITAVDNLKYSLDNYSVAQYQFHPALERTSTGILCDLEPKSVVYYKIRIDLYSRDLTTDKIEPFPGYPSSRIIGTLSSSDYVNNKNYGCIGRYRRKVTDENTGEFTDTGVVESTDGSMSITEVITRPVNSYENPSPKIVECWLEVREDLYSTENRGRFSVASLLINSAANRYALTGTVELLDFRVCSELLEIDSLGADISGYQTYPISISKFLDLSGKGNEAVPYNIVKPEGIEFGSIQNKVGFKEDKTQLGFINGFAKIPDSKQLLHQIPISLAFTYSVDSWDSEDTGFYGVINSFVYPRKGIHVSLRGDGKRIGIDFSHRGYDPGDTSTGVHYDLGVFHTESYTGNTLPLGTHKVVVILEDILIDSSLNVISFEDTTTLGRFKTRVYLDGEVLTAPYGELGITNYRNSTYPISFEKDFGNIEIGSSRVYGEQDNIDYPVVPSFKGSLSNIKIFNFIMDSDQSQYSVEDYMNGEEVPENLRVQDNKEGFSDVVLYKYAIDVAGSCVKEGNIVTFSDYLNAQYSLSLSSNSSVRDYFDLKEGSVVYVQYYADLYSSGGNPLLSARIIGSLEGSKYVSGNNYSNLKGGIVKITDLNGNQNVYNLSGPVVHYPVSIYRSNPEVSEKKKIELWIFLKDKTHVNEEKDSYFISPFLINSVGNTRKLTGTVEFKEAYVLSSILDLEDFSLSTHQWLDNSVRGNNARLIGDFGYRRKYQILDTELNPTGQLNDGSRESNLLPLKVRSQYIHSHCITTSQTNFVGIKQESNVFSAWFKWEGSGSQYLVSGVNGNKHLKLNSSSGDYYSISLIEGTLESKSINNFKIGEWYFLQFDSILGEIFINDMKLTLSEKTEISEVVFEDSVFGCRDSSEYFVGSIVDYKEWKNSPQWVEVREGNIEGILRWFPLQEGYGTKFFDVVKKEEIDVTQMVGSSTSLWGNYQDKVSFNSTRGFYKKEGDEVKYPLNLDGSYEGEVKKFNGGLNGSESYLSFSGGKVLSDVRTFNSNSNTDIDSHGNVLVNPNMYAKINFEESSEEVRNQSNYILFKERLDI